MEVAKMDLKKIIGKRVKYFRNKLNLTQEELAYRAELHYSYIAQIELGKKSCSIKSLNKIASALKVPADSLLRTSDKYQPVHDEKINNLISVLLNKKDCDIEMIQTIVSAIFRRDKTFAKKHRIKNISNRNNS
jgi:transcriptional regulator with XRE-family HTH domain